MKNFEQCYKCIFREGLSWSAHSKCTAKWESRLDMPKGNKHGIKSGWYSFPYNYDPVWMDEKCIKFEAK